MLHHPPAGTSIPAGRRFIFYWLPLAALCFAIFYQSSFPCFQTGELFIHFDKILHFTAYALMAFLAARALKQERQGMSDTHIKLAAVCFSILFGVSDEIHQAFVPGRFASVWDLAADAAGSIAGAQIFFGLLHRFHPASSRKIPC
mgnify:CR=1 FL=1